MTTYLIFSDRDGTVRIADGATGRLADLPGTSGRVAKSFPFTEASGDLSFFTDSGGTRLLSVSATTGAVRVVADSDTLSILANNLGQDDAVPLTDFHLLSSFSALFRLDVNGRLTQLAGEFPETPGALPLLQVRDLVPFADRVFFSASLPGQRGELFVSDGTVAGTTLFRSFYPAGPVAQLNGDIDLDETWILGDRMVFTANYQTTTPAGAVLHTRGVWTTDGTDAGTVLLPVAQTHRSLSDKVLHDDRLWFTAEDQDRRDAVWVTDGTVAGSRLVGTATDLVAASPYAALPFVIREGTRNIQGGGLNENSLELSAPFVVGDAVHVALLGSRAFEAARALVFRIDGPTPEFVTEETRSSFGGNFSQYETWVAGDFLFLNGIVTATTDTLYAVNVVTGVSQPILNLSGAEQISRTYGVFDLAGRAVLVVANISGTTSVSFKVYATDGTAEGTVELAGYNSGIRNLQNGFLQAGDQLFWYDTSGLVSTDGTLAGTRTIATPPNQTADIALHGTVTLTPQAFEALAPYRPSINQTGTDSADLLQGTDGDDALFGQDGNDTILGAAGNDLIEGGNAADFIGGGDGNDTIRGGDGADTIYGGLGDDDIGGGAGNDLIYGAAGANVIYGGFGFDTIYGGSGNDTIYGGGASGNPGNRNELRGNSGDDVVIGSDDRDMIDGGIGNDTLRGGSGFDDIFGGDGDDNIGGGAGGDNVYGGAGNDILWGGTGWDYVYGDTGNDTIYGGEDFNFLFGGDGDDLIFAGHDGSNINGGFGNDCLWGGDGADTLNGSYGNNTIRGGGGDDLISAVVGSHYFGISQGNNDLAGGDGNDTIEGGSGDDTIWGGLGDDVIASFTGRDIINGGPGADMFFFASAASIGIGAMRDIITDFTPGVDVIHLIRLNTTFNGTAGVVGGGQASFFYYEPTGLLIGDQNGNGAADWVLELTGAPSVTEADFLL